MKNQSITNKSYSTPKTLTRRDFLAKSLLTAAAISFPSQLTAQPSSKKPRKKVIVIGAGLAGLSCAYELTKKGHDVLIFEASDRHGGRVQTLREEFSYGAFAEAGAYWLSKRHQSVNYYIKEFSNDVGLKKMETEVITDGRKPFIHHINGHAIPTMILPPQAIHAGGGLNDPMPDLNHWPTELSLRDDEKQGDLLGLLIKLCMSYTTADQQAIEHLRSVSLLDHFRSQGFSNGAIALLRPWFGWWDNLDRISAYYALRDFVHSQGRCKQGAPDPFEWFTLKNGMDFLPNAFANTLNEKIRYQSPVVAMSQNVDSATIQYKTPSGEQKVESGDFLVCAIPFSTLRKIKDLPDFSSGKKSAIEQLSYASVSRIYLQFKERSWDPQKKLNGYGFTDVLFGERREPHIEVCGMNLLDMTYYNQDTPQAILQAYLVGDQARLVATMDKDTRNKEFLKITKEILFPSIRAEIEASYVGGTSKCWDEEEWALGAYPSFEPNSLSTLMHSIRFPEWRICFAGEHTSDFPGWVEGALQSGRRAASEIDPSVSPEVGEMTI